MGQEGLLSVMVVDDARCVTEMLRDILESDGYRVFTAHHVDDALGQLDKGSIPNLFLIDLVMPVKSGMVLARELIRSPSRDVPRILMTGYPSAVRDMPNLEELVREVIQKPFDVYDLLNLVGRCIQKPTD